MARFTPTDFQNLGITPEFMRANLARITPWQDEGNYYNWTTAESTRGQNTTGTRAVGAHQLLPATFNELLPNGNINDPKDNFIAGLMYLDKGYKKYKNKKDAYRAYHGGLYGKGTPHWGPKTEAYANKIAPTIDVRSTPMKQMQMAEAYNQGIGDAPSVGQMAMNQPAAIAPIQYRKPTQRDIWEAFRRQDPLQGARNYTLDPITFESLAGYV